MTRLVLATCAALPDLHHDDGVLLDALAARGIHPRLLAWDDPSVDWREADLVVIRSTWDYAARRDAFVAWADRVAGGTRLWNPAEVVAWNTDKRYLRALADAGVPVVPTRWAERGESVDLSAVMAAHGWERGVVKPVVSSGSRGAVRFAAGDAATVQEHLDELLTRGDAMIQPYLSSIEEMGEVSVVWIDGAITHAVRKRPGAGDFRVQEQYGGVEQRIEPDDALCEVAERTLRHVGEGCRYARVDVVLGLDGAYQVMELELVEPQLFLRYHRPAAERLVDAIAAALLEQSRI